MDRNDIAKTSILSPATGSILSLIHISLPADERDDPRVAGEIESVLTRVLGGYHEGNR